MIHPISSHYEHVEAPIREAFESFVQDKSIQGNPRASFRKFKAESVLGKIVGGRTSENFAGKLPPNPWTPNCVNSQEKSWYGSLYDVDPILVPSGVADPVALMKQVLEHAQRENFNSSNMKLVEERGRYLHYEYTVKIASGPLKGVYVDDVDLFYNTEKGYFDIRSASRTGFRDATNLDFSVPGANKKRVEAIRAAFNEASHPNSVDVNP